MIGAISSKIEDKNKKGLSQTRLKIIGVNPPATIGAVNQNHDSKNISELCGDAREERLIQKKPSA